MTDKATAAPRKAKLRCIRSDCVPVLTSSGFAAGPRVRIPLPPAVSQGRTRPRGLALLEATIVSERPMMGVFNNLVVFDQHVKQNSLNSIVPDLATGWSWSEDGTELTFPLRQGSLGTTESLLQPRT